MFKSVVLLEKEEKKGRCFCLELLSIMNVDCDEDDDDIMDDVTNGQQKGRVRLDASTMIDIHTVVGSLSIKCFGMF